MKKSILLLVTCITLSFAGLASPGGKVCMKQGCAIEIKKKEGLKKQVQSHQWISVLSGPFESFIYRLLK
jgi:hypothetical protein